jgi:RimJ/RimL family protein N-acetyltransferase
MTHDPHWGGTIRKLWSTESDKLRDHLLRLDPANRRLRFAHAVSDRFLTDYASRLPEMGSVVYAYIEDGHVRAVAELRRLHHDWGHEAEAAFSVETPWQNRGIGNELMGRVIRSARNRGIHRLMMSCLAENRKIPAIARKHDAHLSFEQGDVIGIIAPDAATALSQIEEGLGDEFDFLIAVLNLSTTKKKVA